MQIKFWVIRVILGVVLGHGAGFVVVVLHLGFESLVFGDLTEFMSRNHTREEVGLHSLGLSAMIGSLSATMFASFLGVLLAPVGYSDRLVMRSWIMAAAFGAIAGGCFGAFASFLHPQFMALDPLVVFLVVGGVLIGASGPIILRLCVSR